MGSWVQTAAGFANTRRPSTSEVVTVLPGLGICAAGGYVAINWGEFEDDPGQGLFWERVLSISGFSIMHILVAGKAEGRK